MMALRQMRNTRYRIQSKPLDKSYRPSADQIKNQPDNIINSQPIQCACDGGCPSCQLDQIDNPTQNQPATFSSKGQGNFLKQWPTSSGLSLPTNLQTWFESKFNQDFHHVRIHTDRNSQQVAQSLNAKAYTSDNHIGFNQNEFAPQSKSGQRLLAHELTHVVQQSGRQQLGVQLKKKKGKKKKFYQHVLDKIAEIKKSQFKIHEDYWAKLLELCIAVEKQNKADIPALVKEFTNMTADPSSETFALTQELAYELSTRLFFMGLEKQSETIREFYIKKEEKWTLGGRRFDVYGEKETFWEKLVDETFTKVDTTNIAKTKTSLDLLLNVFGAIQKEKKKITPKQLKAAAELYSQIYDPFFSFGHEKTISYLYGALSDQIKRVVAGIQTGLQQLTESATAALEAGQGVTSLNTLETYLNKFYQKLKIDDRTVQLRMDITRSDFKKKRHLDVFLKGKVAKKRRLNITFYDVEQKEGDEKKLLIYRIWKIRDNQLNLLKELYGSKHSTAAAQTSSGKLRLYNLDDWREFLWIKYQEFFKQLNNKEKAIEQVINLLQRYLTTFTISTQYNISDIGGDSVNYLKRLYPRALTGQIIQDCGVYALRNAYLLSLLREKLNMDFRFVMMPNHIALVITGKKLPLIVVNNNQFTFHTADRAKKIRASWNKQPQGGPKDEEQLLGELAGGIFYGRRLDIPFKVTKLPAKTKTLAKYKKDLWTFYKKVAKQPLFGAVKKESEVYQFHLKYLEITLAAKYLHNHSIWPFWHLGAPGLWKKFIKKIKSIKHEQMHAKGHTAHVFDYALNQAQLAYIKDIKKMYAAVKEEFQDWEKSQKQVTELYRAHPKLKVKGVRVAVAERVYTLIEYRFFKKYDPYFAALSGYTLEQLLAASNQPPFMRKINKFEMID